MSQSAVMQSTKKVSVTMKLPQLQNLIKRDPDGYKEEFLMQKVFIVIIIIINTIKLLPLLSYYYYHYYYYY